MLKKIIITKLIIFFLMTISWAEIVKDVKIEGNKRISKESLMVFGEIIPGSNYTQNDLNEILKKIYETNFFKNISLNIENSILVINVVENPIISNVIVNGIRSTKLEEFIIDKMTLKNRSSFLETKFKNDLNFITNVLKASGYYFAEINTRSILNESLNSMEIIYDIELGSKAKISKIQFLGDKNVKDRKLRNVVTSEESQFWKFLSQNVFLNYDRIELDKRLLTNYYKDNGYYNVKVENSFVEFDDNESFKLIFNINSGRKFKFNKLKLVLADDYEQKYFVKINELLNNLKDKEYSLTKIEKVLREVDKIALTKEYEFINATLSEKVIDGNKLNISIVLADTSKFYVEKINILGNSYTIEEVIRNAFIVDEGDAFNEILFNKSLNNIKAKNIFSKVESKIFPGSTSNYKIIDIKVEEKPTGEISLGAGVGTSGGTVGGGIKENNFLGKGIKLDTNLQIAKNSIKGKFIHIKPNFNYTDNTLYTSVSSQSKDFLSDYGWKSSNLGTSVATSFEQYENFYFKPEISTSYEKLETTSIATAAKKKQKGNYFDGYFNYELDYDVRNRRYQPTEGFRNTFYQGIPVISKNYEIINSYETERIQKISNVVTNISFYGKAINSLNNKDVRLSKRLYIPARKLRGFEPGKVGPRENLDYIGGNYISTVNFNARIPGILPSFENTDISYFIDAANIWGVDYDSSLDKNNKIRSSTGIAVDVFTPVGPLNFSISQTLSKNASDTTESFRFNLGTTF
jgi:outer membrane protein insertion porin family